MSDKKKSVVLKAMLKAAYVSILIGLVIGVIRLYVLQTPLHIGVIAFILVALMIVLLYVFNQSIYYVYKLNLIRKAIIENERFYPITLKERFIHNLMVAPFIILLISGVLLVFNQPIQFILLFIVVFIQLFVGNISAYRYKQVYLPYYDSNMDKNNI